MLNCNLFPFESIRSVSDVISGREKKNVLRSYGVCCACNWCVFVFVLLSKSTWMGTAMISTRFNSESSPFMPMHEHSCRCMRACVCVLRMYVVEANWQKKLVFLFNCNLPKVRSCCCKIKFDRLSTQPWNLFLRSREKSVFSCRKSDRQSDIRFSVQFLCRCKCQMFAIAYENQTAFIILLMCHSLSKQIQKKVENSFVLQMLHRNDAKTNWIRLKEYINNGKIDWYFQIASRPSRNLLR